MTDGTEEGNPRAPPLLPTPRCAWSSRPSMRAGGSTESRSNHTSGGPETGPAASAINRCYSGGMTTIQQTTPRSSSVIGLGASSSETD